MLIKMSPVVLPGWYRVKVSNILTICYLCQTSAAASSCSAAARIKLTFVSNFTKISQVLTDNKIIQNSSDLPLLHKRI